MTEIGPGLIAAALFAAVFVGLGKGGLPAVSLLAVPTLALVMSPVRAAALLLPIYVLSDLVGLWIYRREFSRRNLVILFPATLIGIGLGWATASFVSERFVLLMIGAMGLAFSIDQWRKRKRSEIPPRPADVPRGVFWGTLAGFTSFVSHSGGPPYQIYTLPQKLPKMVFAGTTTILFTGMNIVKLVPYWALGEFTTDNLEVAVYLVPVAVIATIGGSRLTRILPEKIFFRIVQTALFLVSLQLLYKGIVG
ncbi:sulfite exporter TauE/SafE family protein [Methylobrevis pamukkalensis]|uniref:Probable membrane transporter protein n=1 Tax=Methylobrevis pamukkalensis TaxID=1439726 RepID=A0A1E3H6Z8_9HYPH|nr:sulfite exporter TauE/SafE family protein [Methylobrevis pamukkalensis]ODN71925.1 Sulfite exporter TauE/SafE [Methylobrevis pamukkalensis]